MAWAFWRGSSPHLNELSRGAARGFLFGQPLSAVCVDDALPKPVMVSGSHALFSNKHEHAYTFTWGTVTSPLFCFRRRSPGHADVPVLRGVMDTGDLPTAGGGSGRPGAAGQPGQRGVPTPSDERSHFRHRWSLQGAAVRVFKLPH